MPEARGLRMMTVVTETTVRQDQNLKDRTNTLEARACTHEQPVPAGESLVETSQDSNP